MNEDTCKEGQEAAGYSQHEPVDSDRASSVCRAEASCESAKPNRVGQLFAALCAAKGSKPSRKEFNEAVAFVKKVQKHLPLPRQTPSAPDNDDVRQPQLVVDVAGSHGLIAMLCLALDGYDEAVIIDPARPASFDTVLDAWATSSFPPGALQSAIRFDQRPLMEALPELLALAEERALGVTVLACHACQHLSDQVVEISMRHKVRFAVMPCCHKDHTKKIKASADAVGVPLGVCMDLVTVGRALERGYDAKLVTIDASITPHNRIVVGALREAGRKDSAEGLIAAAVEGAENKLQRAYERAHKPHLKGTAGVTSSGLPREDMPTCV